MTKKVRASGRRRPSGSRHRRPERQDHRELAEQPDQRGRPPPAPVRRSGRRASTRGRRPRRPRRRSGPPSGRGRSAPPAARARHRRCHAGRSGTSAPRRGVPVGQSGVTERRRRAGQHVAPAQHCHQAAERTSDHAYPSARTPPAPEQPLVPDPPPSTGAPVTSGRQRSRRAVKLLTKSRRLRVGRSHAPSGGRASRRTRSSGSTNAPGHVLDVDELEQVRADRVPGDLAERDDDDVRAVADQLLQRVGEVAPVAGEDDQPAQPVAVRADGDVVEHVLVDVVVRLRLGTGEDREPEARAAPPPSAAACRAPAGCWRRRTPRRRGRPAASGPRRPRRTRPRSRRTAAGRRPWAGRRSPSTGSCRCSARPR